MMGSDSEEMLKESGGSTDDDFVKFAKEKYDLDVRFVESDTPDTFEKIFGVSFAETNDSRTEVEEDFEL